MQRRQAVGGRQLGSWAFSVIACRLLLQYAYTHHLIEQVRGCCRQALFQCETEWGDHNALRGLKEERYNAFFSNVLFYDSATQNIVNSPLLLYVIPYDSYGTLITDNIASYSYSMRMRYKDS
jgi:hypothetical protein